MVGCRAYMIVHPLCYLALFSLASAKTIKVPTDSASVQKGINGATNGDTVVVTSGIYHEHNVMMKSGVTLIGESANPSTTVIDGDGLGKVIICQDLTGQTRIERLTVRGGKALQDNQWVGNGAGISCDNSSPTISNCWVVDNVACYGGGIGLYNGASPILINCVIEHNSALYPGGYGGGLYAYFGCHPIVDSCHFFSDSAMDGGAMHLLASSWATISNSEFTANRAVSGGAIMLDAANSTLTTITNSSFQNNSAQYGDGGALKVYNSSVICSNSQFRANSCRDWGGL